MVSSLPKEIRGPFEALCEELTEERVALLRESLINTSARFEDRFRHELLGPDLKIFSRLRDGCTKLLASYETLSGEQKKLVVGTVRYFLIQEDAISDNKEICGLDDDVRVFNYTVCQLGKRDDIISVP